MTQGLFIPPWFHEQETNTFETNVASIFWGMTLAATVFSATKAARWTRVTWKRVHRFTPYLMMIWGEVLTCSIMGVLCWLYTYNILQTSFWILFMFVFLWSIQIQLLLQILVARVGLLLFIKSHATRLKWAVFAFVLVINISVFIVWIPANLQISALWIETNRVWIRTQKALITVVDVLLNSCFIYLTRTSLISEGLAKYTTLYWFNIFSVFISISLDFILIGLMSLPARPVYQQFQSLAFLVKLNIEMNIGEMICKVVRASNDECCDHQSCTASQQSCRRTSTKCNRTTRSASYSTQDSMEVSIPTCSNITGQQLEMDVERGERVTPVHPGLPPSPPRRSESLTAESRPEIIAEEDTTNEFMNEYRFPRMRLNSQFRSIGWNNNNSNQRSPRASRGN